MADFIIGMERIEGKQYFTVITFKTRHLECFTEKSKTNTLCLGNYRFDFSRKCYEVYELVLEKRKQNCSDEKQTPVPLLLPSGDPWPCSQHRATVTSLIEAVNTLSWKGPARIIGSNWWLSAYKPDLWISNYEPNSSSRLSTYKPN